MSRALGVPVTDHVYEDGEIMSHVVSLGLRPPPALVNAHLLFRKSEYVPQRTTTLCQPFTTTAFAKRFSRCCASAVSNSLPKTVLNSDSVEVFESRLKSFLFSHTWGLSAVGAFLQATSRVPRWWIGERPPDMAASCDIYK